MEQESAVHTCVCVRTCVLPSSLTNHKVQYFKKIEVKSQVVILCAPWQEHAALLHQLPFNLAVPFDFHLAD